MKTLLVALDQSEEAAIVLAHAIDVARPAGAQITLLHVVDVPHALPPPGSVLLRVPASSADLVAAARAHLTRLAEQVPDDLRGELLVETGSPAPVICDIARAREADLVMVGAHRHGLFRRALGTTAARVVDGLDRPLMVVRARAIDDGKARASRELRAEHQRLEAVYAKLSETYRDGDWADAQAEWQVFEEAVRSHMRLEEERLLPAFASLDAAEANAILADHAELRAQLSSLGVAIELHAVNAAQVDELLARMRAHSAREDALFYPWVDANPAIVREAPPPRGEIEVTFRGGKRVDARVGGHIVRTDQPAAEGGEDSAVAPFDLFLASLATCAGLYVLAFCKARDLPTGDIRLRQRVENDPETHLPRIIHHVIELPRSFPEKYRAAIVRAADGCKVKRCIAALPAVETISTISG